MYVCNKRKCICMMHSYIRSRKEKGNIRLVIRQSICIFNNSICSYVDDNNRNRYKKENRISTEENIEYGAWYE